ncbi:MAG: hypothetical protein ABSC61_00640 [Anaerolineales bacterium]
MNRSFRTIPIVLVSLLLVSCAGMKLANSTAATAADTGPRVSFASPASGATVPLGPVQVLLLSEDPLGTTQAEVLVNGESAAMIASPDSSRAAVVLEYIWQPAASGKYVLQAHGQNTAGTWGAFVSLELTVAEGGAVGPMESSTPTEAPTEIAATPTKTETPLMPTPLPPTATNSGITLRGTLSYLQMYPADAPCGTTTNMAIATVSPADSAYSVLLFFRIGNREGTEFKPWTKGLALGPNGPGKFYNLFTTRHIANPVPWVPAQVYYQFVAIDKQGARLFATPVYTNLSIIKCP